MTTPPPYQANTKPLVPAEVTHIVVHCSATPGDRDLGVADMDRMHRQRGFFCVGYHFVIRRDGLVQVGRSLNQRGAHVEGFNHCTVGVCLIGGVDSKLKPQADFTPQQFQSLQGLLLALKPRFPKASVAGHRDMPNVAKACPSFNVGVWLSTGKVLP